MWTFHPQPLMVTVVASMRFIGTRSEVIAFPVIENVPTLTLSKVPGCVRVMTMFPAVTSSNTAWSPAGPDPVLVVPPGVMVIAAVPKSTVVIASESIASMETVA